MAIKNYDALMKSLLALNDFTPPAMPQPSKFQTYMASRALDFGNSGAAANEVGQDHSWKSNLLETFKWLGTPGTLAQTAISNSLDVAKDVMEDVEGGTFTPQGAIKTAFEKYTKPNLRAAGQAAVELTRPLQEIIAIPGVDTPLDKTLDEKVAPIANKLFQRDYSNAPFYNPDESPSQSLQGSNMLKNYFGVDNKWARGIGGFALDVATDPLTYVSGEGLFKGILSGAGSKLKPVGEKLDDLAAGLDTKTPTFRQIPVEQPRFELNQPSLSQGAVSPSPAMVNAPGAQLSKFMPNAGGIPPVALPESARNLGSALDEIPVMQGGKDVPASSLIPEAPAANLAETLAGIAQRTQAPVAPKISPAVNLGAKSGQVLQKGFINPHVVTQSLEPEMLQRAQKGLPLYRTAMPATGRANVAANSIANTFYANRMQSGVRELTPQAQATLYKEIAKKAPSPQVAVSMLRSAENTLLDKGIRASAWSGQGLRLSDVLAALPEGTSFTPVVRMFSSGAKGADMAKVDRSVVDIVANLTAARAAQTGYIAEQIFTKVDPQLNKALNTLPPNKFSRTKELTEKMVQEVASNQGLTEKEALQVRDLVKNFTGVDEVGSWDTFRVVELTTPKIARALLKQEKGVRLSAAEKAALPKATSLIRKAVSKEVDRAAGKINASNLADRVRTFTSMNFTTWMGRGAMYDMLKSDLSPIQVMAKARASWFSNIAKGHTPEEVVNAFGIAQKMGADAPEGLVLGTVKEQALANKFLDYFENILGSTRSLVDVPGAKGLKELVDPNGTVAFRSGMVMSDVNKQLKAMGAKFQFKMGGDIKDWRSSWQAYDPMRDLHQNPLIFMYNLDVAIHRVLAEYNVMDSFAETFGRRVGEQGYDAAVNTHSFPFAAHRITQDIKFPKKQAEQFTRLLEDFERGPWQPNSPLTRMLTTIQRKWKSAVTIYYPSHHVRNMVGDSYLMWVSGINDPRVFNKSLKVLKSQRERYNDVLKSDDINDLTKFLQGDFTVKNANREVITNKFKSNISSDEYYGEMFKRGLLKDADRIEDLYGESFEAFSMKPKTATQRLMRPLGGKGHGVASKVSEVREHYTRMAHVIGYVEKHMDRATGSKLARTNDPAKRSEILKPLLDRAFDQVTKWHPDGTDMTYFEQKWMRNIQPFYSWQRKAVPLLIEAMFMNPSKAVLAYPRAQAALQTIAGINPEGGMWEPFPTDQLFPDWITNGAIGPVGDPESENAWVAWLGRLGTNLENPVLGEQGYTMIDPGRTALPINSIIGEYGSNNFGSGVGNSLSPFFKIPAELVQDSTSTGAPISKEEGGEGYGSYAMSQIPQLSPLQRLTGAGKDYAEGREAGFNNEALINMLTAAGITGTGKYIKSAEFQEQQRASAKRKKEQEAELDRLRKAGVIQ